MLRAVVQVSLKNKFFFSWFRYNYYCGTTKQNNQRKEISCILFADQIKEETVTYLDQTFTDSHSLRAISLQLDHRSEPRGTDKSRKTASSPFNFSHGFS